MNQKTVVFLGFCFVLGIATSSCVSIGGANDISALSLGEAIEQSAAEVAAELRAGTRVAIVAFSSEHESLSNYIMDELTGALVDGNLEVADRRNLNFVYKELKFQMSGDVSDETAVSVGKFLGAPYVITGQFIKVGGRYRYRLSGISVETAQQESSTRIDVRDDRSLQRLIADVRENPVTVTVAAYGEQDKASFYLDRGLSFLNQGDWETARADFNEAIQLDPNLAAAYLWRSNTNWDNDLAIADLNQAIRLDPNNANAYHNRGIRYVTKEDYDRAIADFTQAIRLAANNKDMAYFYLPRATAYITKGAYDRAIADFDQAIRINPNDGLAYLWRGNFYLRNMGDRNRAYADYNQSVRVDPNNALLSFNYGRQGTIFLDEGDYDTAFTFFDLAIRLDPNYTDAYCGRGFTYINKIDYDYDRAFADFNQAIRFDPNYAPAYYGRGLVYHNKRDYDRAIEDFTRAIQLNPNYAYAYEGLMEAKESQRTRGR
jgi:tetratricopeptide (TPR) repeat protein